MASPEFAGAEEKLHVRAQREAADGREGDDGHREGRTPEERWVNFLNGAGLIRFQVDTHLGRGGRPDDLHLGGAVLQIQGGAGDLQDGERGCWRRRQGRRGWRRRRRAGPRAAVRPDDGGAEGGEVLPGL